MNKAQCGKKNVSCVWEFHFITEIVADQWQLPHHNIPYEMLQLHQEYSSSSLTYIHVLVFALQYIKTKQNDCRL